MLTVKCYVNEWNGKLNEQSTGKKVFKEMFEWNYWIAYMHALLILSTFHDKLRRLLFIFLLNVNANLKAFKKSVSKNIFNKVSYPASLYLQQGFTVKVSRKGQG